jgi:hypothetical protein
MADSDALRQRRRRAHRAGDHSLCGARCTTERVAKLAAQPRPADIATCAEAVAALGRTLDLRPDDPKSVSYAVAYRLAQLIDAGETAVMASVHLVNITSTLAATAGEPGDGIDQVRAQYHARIISGFLNHN